MVFNSLLFLVFFAVILAAYNFLSLSWRVKKHLLLVASYMFYAAWYPKFVLLMLFSTIIDWYVAKWLSRTEAPKPRKRLLIVSLIVNLGMLAFFKYGGFILDNIAASLNLFSISTTLPSFDILLPVGISFYTFQTLSYTIDVYRREIEPAKTFLDFALFVSFFPQLVAGPIVRAIDFLPQLDKEPTVTPNHLIWGITLIIIGVFEKVVLADTFLATVADRVFMAHTALSTLDAWIGTLAFAGQIFFDFAGYSLCAIGTGLCLGFALPDNFRFPYAALGFSDFWRRWHISLSSWLRDYLYISLGGNRQGTVRTYINLFLTMLLGGLWHGASWVFVIWGALHGTYLIIERLLRKYIINITWLQNLGGQLLGIAITFIATCYAWVFFRATDFSSAMGIVRSMTGITTTQVRTLGLDHVAAVTAIVGGLLIGQYLLRNHTLEYLAERSPAWLTGLVLAAMIIAITLSSGDDRAFIYFQF